MKPTDSFETEYFKIEPLLGDNTNTTEKLPAESDRTICVSMAVVNNHNVISIKNPVLKNVLISGGRIETGKADKFSHGIGTVNVTDIVEKHGGTVKFSCENNIFNADVII